MNDARRGLITGATGFVGGYLIAHLRAAHPSWHVIGTTRHSAVPDAGFVCCDLRDAALTRSVIEQTRPEMVVHLAGQSNVPASFDDPEATLANNILGTLHLLDACRAHAPHAR